MAHLSVKEWFEKGEPLDTPFLLVRESGNLNAPGLDEDRLRRELGSLIFSIKSWIEHYAEQIDAVPELTQWEPSAIDPGKYWLYEETDIPIVFSPLTHSDSFFFPTPEQPPKTIFGAIIVTMRHCEEGTR